MSDPSQLFAAQAKVYADFHPVDLLALPAHRNPPLQPLLPALRQAGGDVHRLHPQSWPLHFVASYPNRQRSEVACAMTC